MWKKYHTLHDFFLYITQHFHQNINVLSPSQTQTRCMPSRDKPAERHPADRHVSEGHLNSVGSHTLERTPYRAAGAGPGRLAGYLSSCTGVDLSWDRKERLGRWLSGSSLHSRIMPQIGSRSARWEGGGKKSNKAWAAYQAHPKERDRRNGRRGMWGRQEQLFTGPPPRPPPSPPHEATGWLGLRPLPCCSLQSAGVTKTICVSPDRFLPSLPGCAVLFFCIILSKVNHRGPSVRQCYWRVTGWWLWNHTLAKTDSLSRFRLQSRRSSVIADRTQCGSSPHVGSGIITASPMPAVAKPGAKQANGPQTKGLKGSPLSLPLGLAQSSSSRNSDHDETMMTC